MTLRMRARIGLLLGFLAIVGSLLVAVPAWAGTARLQLDTDELTVGQTGRLVLYLVDARTRNAPAVQVPDGVDVRFYGSSQRFSMDNFTRTLLYAYEYRITARDEGTFTIGPIEVPLLDGTTLRTNAVTLQVKQRPADPEGAAITVQAGFGRERAWEGQVVVYSYRLVARSPILGVDWRLPDFEGLRAPQQGNPEERQYFLDEADGRRTTVVEGAIPLLATGTGERGEQAAIAQVRVPDGRSDFLGFRQYRPEAFATEPAGLLVDKLPPAPAGFSGLVGDFAFRAELDDADAVVGGSVPLTLQVVGDGSLEGWSPPELVVEGASIYDNDHTVGARVQDGAYVATGLFRHVVVPTAQGELRIPPIEVVTFSPSRGEYVTHTVDVDPISVAAGRERSAELESFSAAVPQGAQDEVVALDFRDIYHRGPSRALGLQRAIPVLAVPAVAPGLLVVFGLLGERLRGWRARRRDARRPPPSPHDHLRSLPPDPIERLAALDAALRLALAQRAGVEVHALDRAAVVGSLDEPLRGRVDAVGRALDRARFAGKTPASDLEAEVRAVVAAMEAR